MDKANMLLDYFNVGEKDIVMFLFFAAIMAAVIIYSVLEYIVKKVKASESLHIDMEYTVKVLLIPGLCMLLLMKGLSTAARKKAVNAFLYA